MGFHPNIAGSIPAARSILLIVALVTLGCSSPVSPSLQTFSLSCPVGIKCIPKVPTDTVEAIDAR